MVRASRFLIPAACKQQSTTNAVALFCFSAKLLYYIKTILKRGSWCILFYKCFSIYNWSNAGKTSQISLHIQQARWLVINKFLSLQDLTSTYCQLTMYWVFNNDCTPSTAKTSKTLAKLFLYYNSLNKVTLLCKVSDWCVLFNLKKYKLLTTCYIL